MSIIAIQKTASSFYPKSIPYSPNIRYPEYPFKSIGSETNEIYGTVRNLLYNLNFDIANFGTSKWNPLKDIIKPGNRVVIKPNWVNHFNPNENHLDALITHTSIIRPILDYVIIALQGEGQIIIGDAPVQSCDFEQLLYESHIGEVVDYLKNRTTVKIIIKDFRAEIMTSENRTYNRVINKNDNHIQINLSEDSFLYEIREDFYRFRVTSYDKNKMLKYHNIYDHNYLISHDILNADTIIEIPKLKTHHKAGITCCLKNNVGINTIKDCLVHHRKGAVQNNGDAYQNALIFKRIHEYLFEKYDGSESRLLQVFIKILIKINRILIYLAQKDQFFEGSWFGNDTLWRMVLDLNKIVFFADKEGIMKKVKQRNVLYMVDGIICGENEGPLRPSSVNLGLLAFGDDPVKIDIAMSSLIGFDYLRIPLLKKAVEQNVLENNIQLTSDFDIIFNSDKKVFSELKTFVKFQAPSGWINHIEKY
jgi:uncharacterized protein (DUF362 family)